MGLGEGIVKGAYLPAHFIKKAKIWNYSSFEEINTGRLTFRGMEPPDKENLYYKIGSGIGTVGTLAFNLPTNGAIAIFGVMIDGVENYIRYKANKLEKNSTN